MARRSLVGKDLRARAQMFDPEAPKVERQLLEVPLEDTGVLPVCGC